MKSFYNISFLHCSIFPHSTAVRKKYSKHRERQALSTQIVRRRVRRISTISSTSVSIYHNKLIIKIKLQP